MENKFEEQTAQVQNESAMDKVAKVATNKYTLITAGVLAAGVVVWKWGYPAAKNFFSKKKKSSNNE